MSARGNPQASPREAPCATARVAPFQSRPNAMPKKLLALPLLIPLLHALVSQCAVLAQSPTLQRIIELQESEDAKWRSFYGEGSTCQYYWPGWRLDPVSGIRTTRKRCPEGIDEFRPKGREVQVDCTEARIREERGLVLPSFSRWDDWRIPKFSQGERYMVAALCDNLLGK